MGIMAYGAEMTREDEFFNSHENAKILDKLYADLELDFTNEYDRKARTAIEYAIWKLVRDFV